MEKVITINRGAIKANREERKANRLKKKQDREANKKPIKAGKVIGMVGSYVGVAAAAAYTAVKIYAHIKDGGQIDTVEELEDLHPVEDAPLDMTEEMEVEA